MRKNRAKKTSSFGWMPNLSSVRSFAGNLTVFSVLMQIPQTLADTLFSSKNPVNNATLQNVLVCCNGQEKNITALFKTLCGIFNIENLGQFGHDIAGFPYAQKFGNTSNNAPACQLYSEDEHSQQNPCLEGILNKNVTSGLFDECKAGKDALLIALLLIFGIMILCGVGFVTTRYTQKNRRSGETASLFEDNTAPRNSTPPHDVELEGNDFQYH